MVGALMQVAVSGGQDTYLTGDPQITFFALTYRRYTNFAIETLRQNLVGNADFGTSSMCKIDKAGDLIWKMSLVINLPEVSINSNDKNPFLLKQISNLLTTFYNILKQFIDYNMDLMKKTMLLLRSNNIPLDTIINSLPASMHQSEIELISFLKINNAELFNILESQQKLINDTKRFNYVYMMRNAYSSSIDRDALINLSILIYEEARNYLIPVQEAYIKYQEMNKNYQNKYSFAWVNEIGYSIIEQVSVRVGDEVIDTHNSDFLLINQQLNTNAKQDGLYNKMIGNVPELTTFNNLIKPSYRLLIPMQFYFCKWNSMAFPLIAIQSDMVIDLKLRSLNSVAYMEENNIDDPLLRARIHLNDCHFLVDYVYLGKQESKRFAESVSEYLIETVHYNTINENFNVLFTQHFDLLHPTKYMFWFAQPISYRENLDGFNKCRWNRFFSKNAEIYSSRLMIGSFQLGDAVTPPYYNYVQPYQSFSRIPNRGVLVYSFALNNKIQPSGSINPARIPTFYLELKLKSQTMESIYIGIYTVSYNILRIAGGRVGLAFGN